MRLYKDKLGMYINIQKSKIKIKDIQRTDFLLGYIPHGKILGMLEKDFKNGWIKVKIYGTLLCNHIKVVILKEK